MTVTIRGCATKSAKDATGEPPGYDDRATVSRREFIKGIGIGAGAIVLFTQFGIHAVAWADSKKPVLKMVLADYGKCTGCRTCEAVCSSYNRPVTLNGEKMPGLGNPRYSNIRVESFNPEVDVPNVCAMCADTPCVNACPVEPDPGTGRRALYRDEVTHTLSNDADRCIGCGSCAEACAEKRTGVIRLDSQMGKPAHFHAGAAFRLSNTGRVQNLRGHQVSHYLAGSVRLPLCIHGIVFKHGRVFRP